MSSEGPSIWRQFAESEARDDRSIEENGSAQDGQSQTDDSLTPEQLATVKLFKDFKTVYEELADKEPEDYGIKGAVRNLHLHNGDKIGFQLERGDFRFGGGLAEEELVVAMYGSADPDIPETEEVIALWYTLLDPRRIEALGVKLDERSGDPDVRTYASISYYLSSSGHSVSQPFVRMFTTNGGEMEQHGEVSSLRPVNYESLESAAREILDGLPRLKEQLQHPDSEQEGGQAE